MDGQRTGLHCCPLTQYWNLGGARPAFKINCTANWRGYTASWDLCDERLYLTGLHGTLEDGGKASLSLMFPGYPGRVFAHWFSGELIIPQGDIVERFHRGYGGTWERSLRIMVSHGVVGGRRIVTNTPATETAQQPAPRWWARWLAKARD